MTRWYTLPEHIDRTGTRPAGPDIAAFIASLPPGSGVSFEDGKFLVADPPLRLQPMNDTIRAEWMLGAEMSERNPDELENPVEPEQPVPDDDEDEREYGDPVG